VVKKPGILDSRLFLLGLAITITGVAGLFLFQPFRVQHEEQGILVDELVAGTPDFAADPLPRVILLIIGFVVMSVAAIWKRGTKSLL
jgi:hypothetical protein